MATDSLSANLPTPASTAIPLQFAPFSSSISPAFWHKLTEIKLEVLKLSNSPLALSGTFTKGKSTIDRTNGNEIGLGAILELDADSFEIQQKVPEHDEEASSSNTVKATTTVSGAASGSVRLSGTLWNYNTIEEFKNAPKTQLMDTAGEKIWKVFNSGSNDEGQTELVGTEEVNPFIMITFADLKKYKYYYWVGFPALLQKPAWQVSEVQEEGWRGIRDVCSSTEISNIASSLDKERAGTLSYFPGLAYFADSQAIKDNASKKSDQKVPSNKLHQLSKSPSIAFIDPSTHPTAPGWPIRNILYHLFFTIPELQKVQLICWRDPISPQGISDSSVHDNQSVSKSRVVTVKPAESNEHGIGARPSVVGWEKNEKGKLGPRMADLAPLMDPSKLADSAVDLNLQLMKWRIMPELDLAKVKQTKVLLLGAGTLGCYVARTLMAWGVRKITLVDSSTVSFSNPVRQPLFEFNDSLGGGKPKAQAAAESLKRIYPGVDATGITLSIPMPGHPIPSANINKAKEAVSNLEELISEHDVIYLLMDSRESRWLPTVIGASKRKLVMNVALGFDTYLVMRHGVSSPEATKKSSDVVPNQPYTGRLGCYYCNDIVAPMDSLSDRTLDQMCTVTRPGIASIASSTAVELMVCVLQHPLGKEAPSDVPLPSSLSSDKDARPASPDPRASSCLGSVPHQIRGFLAQFHNLKITGQAYNQCTGCSDIVVKAYKKDGFAMLQQAFEDAKFLERLTGLDQLAKESEELMESLDWDEEDSEE